MLVRPGKTRCIADRCARQKGNPAGADVKQPSLSVSSRY